MQSADARSDAATYCEKSMKHNLDRAETCSGSVYRAISRTVSGGATGNQERRDEMWFIIRRLAFYVVAAWVAITVNFLIPRVMPGNAVDTMMAKFPELDANSLKALEAEFGDGHQGSLLTSTSSTSANLAHGNLGLSVNLYPAKVTTVLAPDAAVDADPRRHRDDHQLRARDAARDPRGVAARRLARSSRCRRSRSCRRRPTSSSRWSRSSCSRSTWRLFPFGQGYDLGQSPGLELVVHLERGLPLDPAGADDRASPRWPAGCCRCAT